MIQNLKFSTVLYNSSFTPPNKKPYSLSIFTDAVAEAIRGTDVELRKAAMELPSSLINLEDQRLEGFATAYRIQNPQKEG